jgi:Domain of unknown function (DUF4263)
MASAINLALMQLATRAERSSSQLAASLYVDPGSILDSLSIPENQVLLGRRGTGKTATFRALSERIHDHNEVAVLIDLRLIGSAGIYTDPHRYREERGTRLLADVLRNLVEALIDTVVQDDGRSWESAFDAMDKLVNTTAEVRVLPHTDAREGTIPSARVPAPTSRRLQSEDRVEWSLWTGELRREFDALVRTLPTTRLWVLLDEWSSIPVDLQPMLAELLRRVLVPTSGVSLKIAATPKFTTLATSGPSGQSLGVEIGADLLSLDLDAALRFGGDPIRTQTFFRELLFRHVCHQLRQMPGHAPPSDPLAFEATAFEQPEAFVELSLASEGVPRDGLQLTHRVAARAGNRAISIADVREGAREWYISDKAPYVRSGLDGDILLRWIFEQVIGRRRASGFLVARDNRTALIDDLEAARILHVIRRNVVVKDRNDVYDAYRLDFGCYVHLLATADQPEGLFRAVADDAEEQTWVEVPGARYSSVDDAALDPRLTPGLIEVFENMIAADLPEEEYQRFLAEHPVFLDPIAETVVPKQRLGIEHVTDYAMRRHDGTWLLVEIEKPQDRIFTNAHDLSRAFHHAFGQVIDFQRWVISNTAYARKLMPDIASPRGLLVIGRRSTLGPSEEDKLRQFVQNSATISVLTFDDLAANARLLYRSVNGDWPHNEL